MSYFHLPPPTIEWIFHEFPLKSQPRSISIRQIGRAKSVLSIKGVESNKQSEFILSDFFIIKQPEFIFKNRNFVWWFELKNFTIENEGIYRCRAFTRDFEVSSEAKLALFLPNHNLTTKSVKPTETSIYIANLTTPGREIIRKSTFQANPGRQQRSRKKQDFPVYRGIKFGSITRPWWACVFGASSSAKICFSWLCLCICAYFISNWSWEFRH